MRPPESWSSVMAVMAVLAGVRRHLHDGCAEVDVFGARTQPRQRRYSVGAVRFRGPHREKAEPICFLHEVKRQFNCVPE